LRLYPDELVPNHHFCIHIQQHIHDFGPVYGFWAFLTEQLNFVLKQFHLNNWDQGQLEITMMHCFGCDSALHAMVCSLFIDLIMLVLNKFPHSWHPLVEPTHSRTRVKMQVYLMMSWSHK
jgi:hypothetical protein